MYQKLLNAGTRPLLWQRTDEPFWDDSHVSKMMLEAHLSEDEDGASRRMEFIEQSVEWLSTLIPRCGKILDLGCGPGLYTKRFSEKGYDVTGIDLSRRSIEYAKKMDTCTRYVCQDYLTLDGTAEYDAITLIYCDYAALTKAEREKLLTKVYQLLKPDGIFIFDVFTDRHYREKKNVSNWYVCENGGFWSEEPHLCLEATYLYEDNTVSADQYIVITSNVMKEYIIWDTVYTIDRLTAEIGVSGFRVKSIYSDVCGKAYEEESETLCCIAVK